MIRKFKIGLVKNAYNAASEKDQAAAFADDVNAHVKTFDQALQREFVTTEITSTDGGGRNINLICSPKVMKEINKSIPSIQKVKTV